MLKVEQYHVMREDEGEIQFFTVQMDNGKKATILYVIGNH